MDRTIINRKRHFYVVKTKEKSGFGLNVPQTIDISNTYFRKNGLTEDFLVSRSSDVLDPYTEEAETDKAYFENQIRYELARRVPAFENATVESAASCFYEYNTFDENGIIGSHPAYHNIYIASGFNGHGKQRTTRSNVNSESN